MKVLFAVATVCLLTIGSAPAGTGELRLVNASFMDIDRDLKTAKGHPNEEWRLQGLKSYVSGRYGEAIERFERAASFADKYSQHYLSLIYWEGQGVPSDRVRAYIWSDLAAERGSRKMLVLREWMWARLTPEQQQQAIAQGSEFYARYGDDVAKPRTEREIRRFARNMTGSRVGFPQVLAIQFGPPISGSFYESPGMQAASAMVNGTSNGEEIYARDRINVAPYWQRQDQDLDGVGQV